MKSITKSASRIVFIAISFTVCFSFLFSVIKGRTTFETKDFLPLVAMAFTYYFTMKSKPEPVSENKQIPFSDQGGV